MLFAGWEVRIVKNCDRGLENAARGRRPRAAFSSPKSQFFTIRTDPKPANNLLPGPSRRLEPVIKCRPFLSFFQRYIVSDIPLT